MAVDFTEFPPARGEIYWANLNPARGSEQAGRRPVLVISLDSFNRRMPVVVTAALTTTVRPEVRQGRSRVSVYLPAGEPLEREGCVLCFQITTLARERLEGYISSVSDDQMQRISDAISVAFGLSQ